MLPWEFAKIVADIRAKSPQVQLQFLLILLSSCRFGSLCVCVTTRLQGPYSLFIFHRYFNMVAASLQFAK